MTEYKPQRGERAVFYGFAKDSIEVLVGDYRQHFASVGFYRPEHPALSWTPFVDHAAATPRALDADTQAWAWDTLMEAKRRHEAGESLADMATHDLVRHTSHSGMHLAPIGKDDTCSPLF